MPATIRKAGRYGRRPRDTSRWAPVLEHYLTGHLPAPPQVVDRASKVAAWPVDLNDQLGCCTIATASHEIQAWTAYARTQVILPDDAILSAYEAVGGYVPGDPSTDNGCQVQDVLAYWHSAGIGGHRIGAYAALGNPANLPLLKACLYTFGSVYLGLNLPASAEDQFASGVPWSVVPGSPLAGGHAVPLQRWDDSRAGPVEVVTWGQLQRMTLAFARTYLEEAWVIISQDWIEANGKTVTGLNLAELQADLAAV